MFHKGVNSMNGTAAYSRLSTPILVTVNNGMLFPIDLVLDQGQSLAGKHLRPNASSIFSLAPNATCDVDRYRPSAGER